MLFKYLLVLAAAALTGSDAQFRRVGRMGPREMEALLKAVDPATCRCGYPDQCQVNILITFFCTYFGQKKIGDFFKTSVIIIV
jgi:hypothetical protein